MCDDDLVGRRAPAPVPRPRVEAARDGASARRETGGAREAADIASTRALDQWRRGGA